jgi:hypothetical protein
VAEPAGVWPEPPIEGGGGTTLAARELAGPPAPLRALPVPAETLGGGGTTLFANGPEFPEGLRPVPATFPETTLGGGGTASCVPKSFPITVLTNEVLPAGAGGRGITAREATVLPLSRWRRSRDESAEGGGAITEGAGKLNFAAREDSRSGAETGGGTTETLFICTREGETSRLISEGAGGITLVARVGAERVWSRETRVAAGPITFGVKAGAAIRRCSETFGAGAMMLGSRRGA